MAQITRTPGADIPRNQPHCRREAGPRELWRMRLLRVTDESPRSTEFPLERRCRGGGTRTPDLRFWRPPLYQLSYAPGLAEDCSPEPFRRRAGLCPGWLTIAGIRRSLASHHGAAKRRRTCKRWARGRIEAVPVSRALRA